VTDADLSKRIRRVYAAIDDVSGTLPENAAPPAILGVGTNLHIVQDFSAGRTSDHMEKDAFTVINEIMGIRDRARAWMKTHGKGPDLVDAFLKSHRNAAVVHDLANSDKHGQIARHTVSGLQPQLENVHRAVTLTRDPITGKYAKEGSVVQVMNIETGEVENMPSENTEIVLTGEIIDSSGALIDHLHDTLFWALREWEVFLTAEGAILV
jgi:hypothetical protein